MADNEDKTEAASARRMERARAEGHVPVSREIGAVVVLGVATLAIITAAPIGASRLAEQLSRLLSETDGFDIQAGTALAARETILVVAPCVGGLLIAGALAVMLQTGFQINFAVLQLDLTRLDPRKGLARLWSLHSLMETSKSLLKVVVVVWAMWHVAGPLVPKLASSLLWSPGRLMAVTTAELVRLLLAMLAVFCVLAGFDVVRSRWEHARSLRMSHQELREEHRDVEGDPHVKARLRQLRMQRARRRMLAAVPNATVIVTNPTHYAVALAYDRGGGGAPRVVAKGVDSMAARIRAMALQHRVPLVASPALARALYRVEIDADIPPEHYRAVAEVIAYVWRLRSRAIRVPA